MACISAVLRLARGSFLMSPRRLLQPAARSAAVHGSTEPVSVTPVTATPPDDESGDPPGAENTSLVESLATLGVDLAMVRQRQPGVLRKAATNERGLARFLRGKGASREMVAGLISRYPRAITRSGPHLDERWRLWKGVFPNDGEIVAILERSPESFFRSSDNGNLEKNILFLGSLGLKAKDLHRLLTTAPRTFSNSVELNRQMVELLRDVCAELGGERPDDFVRAVISRNLYILIRSTKRIRANVAFLRENLGLSDGELLELLRGHGAGILDLSNEYLKRNFATGEQTLVALGCDRSEIKKLISVYAPVLFISPDNLKKKLLCLVEGGVAIAQILKRPKVLDFSIENLKSRLADLRQMDYDFGKNGIGILDTSRKRFEAKLQRLSVCQEE